MKFNKYKKLFSDSALIVFSVLFALFINECRGSVVERGKTEKIVANIQKELTKNQKILTDLRVYHQSVLENIGEIYAQDSLEAVFFPGNAFLFHKAAKDGVMQESLSDIAWEIGKQNNISSRIDFEKSLLLHEAYEQQRIVNETIDDIVAHLSNREIMRKELLDESVRVLARYFNELTGQESVLLRDYKNALEVLKEK